MVLKQIKSQGVSSRPPSSPRSSPSWVPLRSAHPQPSQQGFPVGVTGCTAGSEPQNVRNRATAAPGDSPARPVPPSNPVLFVPVLAERTRAASLPARWGSLRPVGAWCWEWPSTGNSSWGLPPAAGVSPAVSRLLCTLGIAELRRCFNPPLGVGLPPPRKAGLCGVGSRAVEE